MLLDMHVHSYYSRDSANKPALLLKKAKKLGIGLAITDHNNCGAWAEYREENLKYNVPLIYGEEIKIYRNGEYLGELLGYFMQEEIKSTDLDCVLDALKQQDAIISIAHPFDYLRSPLFQTTKELDYLKKKVHAIEAFNSRCYLEIFNKKAQDFAKRNALAFTAGSDAHFLYELGNGLLENDANSLEEFRKNLKKSRISMTSRLSGIKCHIYTSLVKRGIVRKEHFFKDEEKISGQEQLKE